MNRKRTILLSILTIGALLASRADCAIVVTVAEDDASNYGSWTGVNGDGTGTGTENHGTGLDSWVFRKNIAAGFAGSFLADTTSNGDLNNIASGSGSPQYAWGTFANGAGNFQESVAFRGFGFNGTDWDNRLDPKGGIFRISIEHGAISSTDAGSNNRVGFVLRNGNSDAGPGNYNTNQRFEFSFRGGDANYTIFDENSPPVAGTDTGIPFTANGVDVEITLSSGNTYILKAFDSSSPTTQLGSTITGTFQSAAGTSIDSVALYNRNAESANVYFNNIQIQRIVPEPTTLGLVGLGLFALQVSRRRRHH